VRRGRLPRAGALAMTEGEERVISLNMIEQGFDLSLPSPRLERGRKEKGWNGEKEWKAGKIAAGWCPRNDTRPDALIGTGQVKRDTFYFFFLLGFQSFIVITDPLRLTTTFCRSFHFSPLIISMGIVIP